MDKGWDIKVEGKGAREATTRFNGAMYAQGLTLAMQRRLQRAAIELLVGAGDVHVGIVCSGNARGYVALSVSATESDVYRVDDVIETDFGSGRGKVMMVTADGSAYVTDMREEVSKWLPPKSAAVEPLANVQV